MNYPPMWNKTLEQQRITGERLKLWVMNLGTGQQGTTSWRQGPTHVCLYKNAGGEWHVPEGDRKGGETLRQAASRIASDRLGLRINTGLATSGRGRRRRRQDSELGGLSGGTHKLRWRDSPRGSTSGGAGQSRG